jgi:hypothetical protein
MMWHGHKMGLLKLNDRNVALDLPTETLMIEDPRETFSQK